MRVLLPHRGLVGLLLSVTIASCSNSTEPARIGVDVASAASIGQGQSDTIAVTLTRVRYDGIVHLSVTGTTANVNATVTPATVGGALSAAQLIVTATGVAAPGTSQLTVHATGDGIDPQTASVDVTVTVTGSYTLASMDTTVRVARGGAGGTTVLVSRLGGHADSVHLTVSGAPAGLTVTPQPAGTISGAAWLDVTAGNGVPTGLYALTVHGAATGLAEQTTKLNVRVIAAPAVASLSIPFCAGDEPSWMAYQNDGYRWTQATPTGSTFTFDATNRVAIAFAYVSLGYVQTVIYFATRDELAATNSLDCPGSISVSGTTLAVPSSKQALVAMGASSAAVSSSSLDYTLDQLPARALDVVGTRAVVSGAGTAVPDRFVIRRGLTPADQDTLPAIDFAGADAFRPDSATLTITGAGTFESVQQATTLWSSTSTYGLVQTTDSPGASMTMYAIPAAKLATGDVHELALSAGPFSGTAGREVYSYFASIGNRTEAFGPSLATPAVSSLTTSPYLRLLGRLPAQSAYDTFARFGFYQQLSASDERYVVVAVSARHLGGTPSTWNIAVPVFGDVSGFDPTWMPATGQQTAYFADAFSGRSELLFGAMPVVGDRVTLAYVVSNTTALRALRSRPAGRHGRPRAGQYFRR